MPKKTPSANVARWAVLGILSLGLILSGVGIREGGTVFAGSTGVDRDPLQAWLTPFAGWSAAAPSGGFAANPAALVEVEAFTLGVEVARPLNDGGPSAEMYVYQEPDLGLGNGQLGYAALREAGRQSMRIVYAAAKPVGPKTAVGVEVFRRQQDGQAVLEQDVAWGMDVGVRGVLSKALTAGAVVHNVWQRGDEAAYNLPTLAAGAALDLGGIMIAGDWLLQGRQAPFAQGFTYGVAARLGPLEARFGSRKGPEADGPRRDIFYGLGYGFKKGGLDITVGEQDDGRVLSVGASWHF